jgi:hypothetical protein
VSSLVCGRLVDPCGGRQRWWLRRLANEPLRGARVGGIKDALALGVERLRLAVVDDGGGHEADPGVAVGVVVPVEELPAERPGLVDVLEAVGDLRPVFQRLRGVEGVMMLAAIAIRPLGITRAWPSPRMEIVCWPSRAATSLE